MVSSTSQREDKWAGYHGREGTCRLVTEGHAEQKTVLYIKLGRNWTYHYIVLFVILRKNMVFTF